MDFNASLNKIRVAPRKMRLLTNMLRGMSLVTAKAQLQFLTKKNSPLLLKLVNSAASNVKNNFSDEIKEESLYIKKIVVEDGPTLKRWLPRAMGRATPLMKRTCSVKLVLSEKSAAPSVVKKQVARPEVLKPEEVLPEELETKREKIEALDEQKSKMPTPPKPYDSSGMAKRKSVSRQTFGNIKKVFRRKTI